MIDPLSARASLTTSARIELVFKSGSMEPRAEQVWVSDVQVWGDKRSPGLLLGWRQRKGVWEGWVITAQVGPQESGPFVRQGWVRAESITRRDD